MSELQNGAKPYLMPLFDGTAQWLDAAGRTAVAAWAAMSTMTGEFLSHDPTKIAIPQSDRDRLMQTRIAPKDWRIWIGKYQRKNWPGQWVHSTFPIVGSQTLPDAVTVADRLPTLQTTAFVIGQLFVFAMSSVHVEILDIWDWRTAPRARFCLRQLWPYNGGTLAWPPAEMTDTDAEAFARAFVRYSDDLASRVGYR